MTDGVNGGADGLKWPFHEQTATSRKKNMAPVFFFFFVTFTSSPSLRD